MMRFCTYFDGRYAPRGLVMLRSLADVLPEAEVWVLGLDARALAVAPHAPPGARFVPLDDLLAHDAILAGVRASAMAERGWLMTVKPSWLGYVLQQLPPGETLTYVDADMIFLESPAEAVRDCGAASVALSPQRFTTGPRAEAAWGRFNAGWIGLRHEAAAMSFLDAWRADCMRHLSPAYSNQKFLDRVPGLYANVHVMDHAGVNVAPWNVGGATLGVQGERMTVNGRPLVAYHMAGLFRLPFGRCATGVRGHVLRGPLRERVYEPYLERLRAAARDLGTSAHDAVDRVQWPQGFVQRWLLRLLLLRAWARGGALRFGAR